MGEYRTTTGEAKPLPSKERRGRRKRILLGSILAVLIIGAVGMAIRIERVAVAHGHVMTEAYAEVYPSREGRVSAIEVFSNERVVQGQPMVRLDDAEERALLAEAQSLHRKAEAEYRRRTVEIAEQRRAHQDRIRIARLRVESARGAHARLRELYDRRLAAAATVEEYRLQEDLAEAELDALLETDLEVYAHELRVLAHDVEARAEAVTRAEVRVHQCVIEAPLAGLVVRYDLAIGERVRPDRLLYEIFGEEPPVIKVRVRERDAARVGPGLPYRATLTSLGGVPRPRFYGEVLRLRDVIQTDGRGGYRQATCGFDPGDYIVPMGAGAEVRIYCGRISFWAWLLGLDG